MSRCVNCALTLVYRLRRCHLVGEATDIMVRILRSWITPATMSVEDVLCQECYTILERASLILSSGSTVERTYGHRQVCFVCGSSILRARTHKVPIDSRERNLIMQCIPTQQIHRLERVCLRCWSSACRSVKRQTQYEQNRQQQIVRTSRHEAGVAESCADVGDSGPVEGPRVENADICDDDHDDDDDDDDSDTLVESNVCRVCLALDVKMYDLKDIELREMFQDITGIAVPESNHSILERLCWECAGRLKAAAAFRNKALLSDALLQRLANTGEQIRKNDITLIKETEDYLKTAATLSVVEVFHTVEIDPENESLPSISKNNDKKIVHSTRKDSAELKKSIIEENNYEMDVEDEPMIEVPIKTEIEYDPICNTGEENGNIVFETNPLFSNNIPLREDTINSAYSSPPPGCSHVEPKYPILGCLLKTSSDCENKTIKTVVKITNSISKIVPKKSKELISHDHTYFKGDTKFKNINVKVGGISKKTLNQKQVKKTQVKANTSTDEECLRLENFEF